MLVAALLVAELVVAVPFLAISPEAVRGVPGPLVVVLALIAAFVAGPWIGLAAMGIAVAVGASVLGLSAVATAIVWMPVAGAVGVLGVRVRRGERLREDLLRQLRGGLVALSDRPRVGHLDVVSRYLPAVDAQILAGDFYGIVQEPDGSVAVLVGDVTGHGPEAAAVATHLRAAWRSLAAAGVPASDVARMLNETLMAEQDAGRTLQLVSVCLGSIRADRSTACFVNAGHPWPILVSATGARPVTVATNQLLGASADRPFSATDIILPAEPWSLLLYTDGLIEGRVRPNGERPFGEQRLIHQLSAYQAPLSASAIDQLIDHVERANGQAMQDDIVVLCISPAESAAQPATGHANGSS